MSTNTLNIKMETKPYKVVLIDEISSCNKIYINPTDCDIKGIFLPYVRFINPKTYQEYSFNIDICDRVDKGTLGFPSNILKYTGVNENDMVAVYRRYNIPPILLTDITISVKNSTHFMRDRYKNDLRLLKVYHDMDLILYDRENDCSVTCKIEYCSPLAGGIIGPKTNLRVVESKPAIDDTQPADKIPTTIRPTWNFEEMGIGGLDHKLVTILRRAFMSRMLPKHFVERESITHVKGILLYGPPGTGKTLIARNIAKMINSNEPIIVNGPEILHQHVGVSEENVRKLFLNAEKDTDSGKLHMIIIDEMDAICRKKGSSNSQVYDNVVDQLLTKMDGIKPINNIVVIGLTNRKKLIDPSLLRPGRFEVHVKIGLPDAKGRMQILKIQTKNKTLADDIDLEYMADLINGFSGADIAGLVRCAQSYAIDRHMDDLDQYKITQDDFAKALDEIIKSKPNISKF